MKPSREGKCPFCGATLLFFDWELVTMHEAPLCKPFGAMMRANMGPGGRESMHTFDPVTGEATEIGPSKGSA